MSTETDSQGVIDDGHDYAKERAEARALAKALLKADQRARQNPTNLAAVSHYHVLLRKQLRRDAAIVGGRLRGRLYRAMSRVEISLLPQRPVLTPRQTSRPRGSRPRRIARARDPGDPDPDCRACGRGECYLHGDVERAARNRTSVDRAVARFKRITEPEPPDVLDVLRETFGGGEAS
jgi:hypothetical protein